MSRKVRWIVLLLISLPMAYLAWQIYSSARYASNRTQSRSNLKQIGTALHNYHDKYDSFPPAYVLGPDEKPWHSWRVLLLPFLGEEELYAKYRFDEPWDGPHNRELQALRPKVFASPLQTSRQKNGANYLAVVSRRTVWPAYFPVRIGDVTDGISNTIQLIEKTDSDVVWTEPRDMRERDALGLLTASNIEKKPLSPKEGFHVLMADGAVRFLSRNVERKLFLSMLTPSYQRMMVANDRWPPGLLMEDQVGNPGMSPAIDVHDLPGTRVVSTPELSFQSNQTVLYCATVQLAWDQLRPEPTAPVKVLTPMPVSEFLNAHPFPVDALAAETYFTAVAGLDSLRERELIPELTRQFPQAETKLLRGDGLDGIRILVYLQKSMPFSDVLQRFTEPLHFNEEARKHPVESFGWQAILNETESTIPALQETVSIADYLSNDDFVVKLKTNSRQADEILLAKIRPQETLRSTWESVAARLEKPAAPFVETNLRGMDHLQIPVLMFALHASFDELIGLRVVTQERGDRPIHDARQMIHFRLDEYGADLMAETQMVIGENGGDHSDLKKPRRLIFDKPFLVALRERDAEVPYFLAWIGNADLMESAK